MGHTSSETIFIPVPIHELDYCYRNKKILQLQKLKIGEKHFAEQFDYANLAKIISARSNAKDIGDEWSTYDTHNDSRIQVGQSFEKAEDIVNLHSHRFYYLIVQVSVLPDQLIQCENSKLWLANDSTFQARQIISARPMPAKHYRNTARQHDIGKNNERIAHKEPELLWPKIGTKLIQINNPDAQFPLAIDLNRNKKIIALREAIDCLRQHADYLEEDEAPDKSNDVKNLANQLNDTLTVFIEHINKTIDTATFPNELEQFKIDFAKQLPKQNQGFLSIEKKLR